MRRKSERREGEGRKEGRKEGGRWLWLKEAETDEFTPFIPFELA